ncbi:SIR2 family protein [Photobacterium sp. J15]|uniref:SIR2 family protein n=1 Tax=Photobacterium sp. J15 TaxID=265901 RepID=UPI0007E32ABC|nr:SIR2 family protein [Photobacterium sp. J15]
MTTISFLSTFVKRKNGLKKPVPIDLDSDNLSENDDYLTLLNYINNTLDFDNLVVLAGSGTSLTFSGIAPSMDELWNRCRDDDSDLFNAVLDTVQYDRKQLNRDENGQTSNDIELLLSLCDQYLALDNLGIDESKKLSCFLERSKKIILTATNFTDRIKPADWKYHDKFIRSVGRRSTKQQRLKLFTTNYDLAFEHSAANTGFVVVDGFEFSSPSYFNPSWFRYDIVDRSDNSKNSSSYISNVLQLYKMHGSVNWTRDNGRVKKLDYKANIENPVFIYPSCTKYQTSYDSPYLDMMSAFLHSLQQPKTALICLGFGFNDKHINNAVTMALRTNPEFNLLIATKEPFDTRGSFNPDIRDLLHAAILEGDRRIAIIDGEFSTFSDLLQERRKETPEEKIFKTFETLAANVAGNSKDENAF